LTEITASSRLRAVTNLMFGYDGRIGRLYYWVGLAATSAITGACAGLAEQATVGTGEIGRQLAAMLIAGILIWMHSAVTIKRLHDRNHNGAWYLLYGFAPPGLFVWATYEYSTGQATLAGVLYALCLATLVWSVIALGLLRGTPGENRYGPAPV
jgi:uncharacterized membrane protein YhaH (DUF805 family)